MLARFLNTLTNEEVAKLMRLCAHRLSPPRPSKPRKPRREVPEGKALVEDLTVFEEGLVRDNQKVVAVEEVRARLGIGLKEAKDVVDIWCIRNNIQVLRTA